MKALYFGVLKDLSGCEREDVELPADSLAHALVERLERRDPAAAGSLKSIAIAVNREYVRGSTVLRDGDEVALLPPVSGGRDAD